jgi:predicted RNA binding protein YcfA (HicA-like mRNA interferase family)
LKYRDFLPVLLDHGFQLDRTKGSHRQYKAFVDGKTRLVTVDYSQPGEDISPKNLAAMIRQSGLPKKLFR